MTKKAKVIVRVWTERGSPVSPLGERSWTFESEKLIDHNDASDRKWLASHCFWALRNDRRVTTETIEIELS